MKTSMVLVALLVIGYLETCPAQCTSAARQDFLRKMQDTNLDDRPEPGMTLRSQELNFFGAACGGGDSLMAKKFAELLTNDKFPSVRREAADALAGIDLKFSKRSWLVKSLKSALHDSVPDVRFAAASALVHHSQADSNEITDSIINFAKGSQGKRFSKEEPNCAECPALRSMAWRISATRMLGMLKNGKARKALKELSADQDSAVSNAASSELATQGGN